MKVLVVYATKTGCTKTIAEDIAETLKGQGADVSIADASAAQSPSGFDAVVIGSGVRAGRWHKSASEWVVRNADALRVMPVAMFTCGLMIRKGKEKENEVRAYTDALLASSGIKPVSIGLLPGWFEPGQFGWGERTILKLMKTPQGDFRDKSKTKEWVSEVLSALRK